MVIESEVMMFITKWNNKSKTRAELLSIIRDVIKAHNWTQAHAGSVLKLDQPKVSSIENLKTKGFSLERMFMLLSKLDYDVEITVKKITKSDLN